MNLRQFIDELRRRHVFRVAAWYCAAAWVVIQVASTVAPEYDLPSWTVRAIIGAAVLGFPVALLLAWAFDLTEAGLQRAAPVPVDAVAVPDRRALFSLLLAIAAGLLLGVGAVTGWRALETPAKRTGVVVLPFENGSGRKEDAYLSEGFADELRDQLSRVPELRVVARPSSIQFRDQNKSASAIAAELDVGTVVEGSLRKEGGRVRISVRLIDATNDTQLWSESYDRNADDMLTIQQQVALAATRQILPQVNASQVLPPPQWQASVHDMMLLARNYQQNAVAPADFDEVVSLYQSVIQKDPTSAPAHARLAKALLLQGKDLPGAEAHARRALALDPNLAEGHAILGFLLWVEGRRGSGREYARAVELNPNDAEAVHYYGTYLSLQRSGPKGTELLQRARDLDPMSIEMNADLAWYHAVNGDVEAYERAMAIMPERFPDGAGKFALARVSQAFGDLDLAIALAMEVRQLEPDNDEVRRDIAEWLARLGLDAEAQKVEPEPSLRILFWQRRYDEIIARMMNADLDQADADSLGFLAFALQAVGRDAEAIPVLEALGLPQTAQDDDLRRWAYIHHLSILIGSLNAIGQVERARQLAQWLNAFAERQLETENGWSDRWWNACALAVLDEQDKALDELEAAVASPVLGYLPYLEDAACFRGLESEPRYRAAIAQLELRHAAIRDRLPATLAKYGFTMAQL